MNRTASWGTLLLVIAVTALFLYLGQSQVVAPSGGRNTGFDAGRAFATLTRLLQEQRPHVAGSAENAVVRDRILAEFVSYGYKPEVQSAFQCAPAGRFPGCTQVENIIAVHKGTRPGKALLATAHYDSVPAGPGVGDDGAGVAVMLELARTMATRETKNDIVFLITDGEEVGLRGAYAFAERHPLMKQIGLVLNVEARGAAGPSMMFETGPGNAALMDLFAATVDRPIANSLIYEVYKLLPNDTDFSVYRDHGLTGFNFAFSASASLYHSRNDNLANLDRATFRHHGNNAFALAAVLADADLVALQSSRDASYFDVFGHALIAWPAALNLPLALAALLGVVVLIGIHRSAFTWQSVLTSVVALIAVPLLLFAAGWLLSFPLGIWPGVHPIDHPQPWPARVALAGAAIFVALTIATAAGRRADPRALLLVNWMVLAGLAVAVAVHVTGASFLLVWPSLVLVIVAFAETALRKTSLNASAFAGVVIVAAIWLPYLLMLELVLGFDLSHFKILALVPFALAIVPVLAATNTGRSAHAATAAIAGLAAAIASQTPAYTPSHPRGVNVTYYDDPASTPRWLADGVGAPDEASLMAMGFPAKDEAYEQFGFFPGKGRLKPATDLKLAPPSLTINEIKPAGTLSVATATLRGARGGLRLAFAIAPKSGIRSIRVLGEELANEERLGADDPVLARMTGLGARDVPVEITFDPAKTPSLIVIERSALPEGDEARALVAARPANAAPVHGGDAALVGVKVDLLQPPPAP